MFKIQTRASLEIIYSCILFLILIATVFLYWHGLDSLFIFDDDSNLKGLQAITRSGGGLNSIGQFVTEGFSGQLGRPISLLTFALQHEYYSIGAWYFKYANLMIHLINGCLIFWLVLLLNSILKLSIQRSLFIALLTSAIWLMHPLHVSTVLYVIQRMTELSVLFTLAGLITYLKGRQCFAENDTTKGFILISLGIGLGGILATLSKENGVLLILYVITLESTVLRTVQRPPYWRTWFSIFIIAPLTLLIFYFTFNFNSILSGYSIRDFTMGERLLTQTRVLWEYIAKIFLLNHDFGLFHDDFPISRSLFTPPTTILALLSLIALFIIALYKRKIYPIFALGVFWFLSGHILESSFIGLIRYFEHRNYLPMLGVIFAAVHGIIYLFERMRFNLLKKFGILLSIIWLSMFPLATSSQTSVWARPIVQAILWADGKPYSRFAQAYAAGFLGDIGEYAKAVEYYKHMVKVFPENTGPYALWLALACQYKDEADSPNMDKLIKNFKTQATDTATVVSLRIILKKSMAGRCNLTHDTIITLLDALTEINPDNAYKRHFYYDYAMFYAMQGRYGLALEKLEKAGDTPQIRMERIAWLVVEKRWEEALFHLDKARKEMNPVSLGLYLQDLDDFEALIHKRMNQEISDKENESQENKEKSDENRK